MSAMQPHRRSARQGFVSDFASPHNHLSRDGLIIAQIRIDPSRCVQDILGPELHEGDRIRLNILISSPQILFPEMIGNVPSLGNAISHITWVTGYCVPTGWCNQNSIPSPHRNQMTAVFRFTTDSNIFSALVQSCLNERIIIHAIILIRD